ncbi:MAG: mycothiol synthase [Sciscionella sp.]|nr:mycothiol synthase [Sciscionella sp.]
MINIDWYGSLAAADVARVRALLVDVRAVDGRPELPVEGLPAEFLLGQHALASEDDQGSQDDADAVLVGYAHLDTHGDAFGREIGELLVHPAHRGRGVGGALLDALVRRAGVGEGHGDRLRLWAHGDQPAAARLAASRGFVKVREMYRMRLPSMATAETSIATIETAAGALPDGVRVRTIVAGVDERAVIGVNARAFDWHPEQGALTVDGLREIERADFFDPAGFFLAEDSAGELLGFHWTKVHADFEGSGERVGEVYVLAVDPRAQGIGLGKALTGVGLDHLRRVGVDDVILYVESDNRAAIAVYERLGFSVELSDVQYAR